MTVWEHRKIVKELNAKGMLHVNEDMIFDAYSRLKRLEQNAATVTAATRRRKTATRKKLATENSVKHFFTQQEPDYNTGFKPDPNEEYLPFEELIHDPFNHNR
jgi:putative transposase